jgi:hypothetical protein
MSIGSSGSSPAAGDAPVPGGTSQRAKAVVELRIPAEERFHPVARLVAGGLASRAELDVERVDDLRLAVQTIFLQPPAEGSLELRVAESNHALDVRIGPFSQAAGLDLVLKTLADDFGVHTSARGDWITVRVVRGGR